MEKLGQIGQISSFFFNLNFIKNQPIHGSSRMFKNFPFILLVAKFG